MNTQRTQNELEQRRAWKMVAPLLAILCMMLVAVVIYALISDFLFGAFMVFLVLLFFALIFFMKGMKWPFPGAPGG